MIGFVDGIDEVFEGERGVKGGYKVFSIRNGKNWVIVKKDADGWEGSSFWKWIGNIRSLDFVKLKTFLSRLYRDIN